VRIATLRRRQFRMGAILALKSWTNFSVEFLQGLSTDFQYLSAVILHILQLNIGKLSRIKKCQSKI